ncbi:MAG: tRNA1(Val) (adenine(37)-N6)-methyltransferase [Hyphomicrobiaceae bacterium]
MTAPPTDGSIPETTVDSFLGSALSILQPRTGYRAGIDAVLLAATAIATGGKRSRILDIGAGVGVVGLCAAARLTEAKVVLVEKHRPLVALAEQNIARNGMVGRVSAVHTDVLEAINRQDLAPESFDIVLSNPPFYEAHASRPSPDPLKADAHVMPAEGLQAWLRFAARMTRPGGCATMIHRADHLPQMIDVFSNWFGDLVIQPLHAREGQPANRVIVRGCKGSRKPLRLLAGLIVHRSDHGFRPEIDRILRSPSSLPLDGEDPC